ncbi:MAG: tRNA-dihydrouridine synthase family protein [Anaerolineales bacterium]|nr:tRNA-dihydrouridine synthase family protein [Anaerolineales bacterium]
MKFSNNMDKSTPPEPSADFFIGNIPVFGDCVLAPMTGFSDPPYRFLCRTFGSSLSYTVFINAMDVLDKWERTLPDMLFLPQERPFLIQLFDNDEDRILAAALKIQQLKPDAIDLNMGCSTRRVSGRGAGAGLLKDPAKIARIVHRLHTSLDIPITAKIRIGWDQDSRNYLDVTRAFEENGGAMIAVHARTREQAYSGQADWETIADIKRNLSIPVIGNGDVRSVEDIQGLKTETGCDGVMIGRAAVGNPWIFQRRRREDISREELSTVLSNHLAAMLTFYGNPKGLELFRKHLVRYLEPENISLHDRRTLLTQSSVSEFILNLAGLGYNLSLEDPEGTAGLSGLPF